MKASGGIRTAADALAMLDAGATRLGLSAPGPCSTGWAEDRRRQRLAKQGSLLLPVGMAALRVEKWLVTPLSVTCTLSA